MKRIEIDPIILRKDQVRRLMAVGCKISRRTDTLPGARLKEADLYAVTLPIGATLTQAPPGRRAAIIYNRDCGEIVKDLPHYLTWCPGTPAKMIGLTLRD